MAEEIVVSGITGDVEEWNNWRKENPETKINLEGGQLFRTHRIRYDLHDANLKNCDLRESYLRGANFKRANFTGSRLGRAHLRKANLAGANLRDVVLRNAELEGTNLRGANLSGADLSYADLEGADLTRAKLQYTNLSGANLRGAIFRFTSLRGAQLQGAYLSGAIIAGAIFREMDLRGIQKLNEIIHEAPSGIDDTTIQQSRGKIPITFLQGCGLSDPQIVNAINALPFSNLEQGVEIADPVNTSNIFHYSPCFISYHQQDRVFARQVHGDLQKKGVRCWFLHENPKIRNSILRRVGKQIQSIEKILVILPEVPVSKERKRETGNLKLFLIEPEEALLPANMPLTEVVRSMIPIGEFTKWQSAESYKVTFELILKNLKTTEN